jgi:hypothetical protein
MKYAVGIDGKIVVWEDGKFKGDEDVMREIREAKEDMQEEPYLSIPLDGSILYSGEWRDPEEVWALSYGFLQKMTGGDMDFVAGDRPTWEALGQKEEEDTIY